MAEIAETVDAIVGAESWSTRVNLIRQVPQKHGLAAQPTIYADVARRAYVPSLAPDFAYVHWIKDYELPSVIDAYQDAYALTAGFMHVDEESLTHVLEQSPHTLRIFRLLLGFTAQEFAASTTSMVEARGLRAIGASRVKSLEAGSRPLLDQAKVCAAVIDGIMKGDLFGEPPGVLRRKQDKPDTEDGWARVRTFAEEGVPLPVFLHQRHYGGAFRQLLDATSTIRGNLLEDPVASMFDEHGISYIQTGSTNQAEIEHRFGLSVHPAPDFVVFDRSDTLRAILECKGANDGGTARDKAARFRGLRQESQRLGGVPLFAVIGGLGWNRTNDALGPVVRDTDGRVFTLTTLHEMLHVDPFPHLISVS